jgi:cell division protein FtsQ
MNAKTTIRKVLFVAIWLCIGGVMVTLLLAAITKKNNGNCKGYTITIEGAKNNLFIDKKDVEQLLFNATKGPIKGDPIAAFDLHELEKMLEKNNWIDEAELYFDNKDVLHVSVIEKEPVARIFTTEGNSFYLNENGKKMPLSDKMSARVPVFTGYADKKKKSATDSLFLKQITAVANYIGKDPFWMSQVAQIDITKEGSFEMIPLVGNHLVKLGSGENIENKLNRLMIFYKQVLSKTGFDRYKIIDVQYKGQVVVSKVAGEQQVDAAQLKKNVEKLLRQSEDAEKESAIKVLPAIIKLEKDSTLSNDPELKDVKTNNLEKKTDPNPLKSSLNEKEESLPAGNTGKTVKPKQVVKEDKLKPENRTPKAVMPKKEEVENKEENGGYN